MDESKARWPWLVFATLVVIVVSTAAWWHLTVVEPAESRFAEAQLEVEDQHEAFAERRWTRPVLRGEAVDGNAAAVLDELGRELTRNGELRLITYGSMRVPIERPDATTISAADAQVVERARAAVQHGWSWNATPPEGDDVALAERMLASAEAAEPGECMRIAADLVRAAQDLYVATESPAISQIERGLEALLTCARFATPEERDEAARELVILSEHPPPLVFAFERAVDEAHHLEEPKDAGWLAPHVWDQTVDAMHAEVSPLLPLLEVCDGDDLVACGAAIRRVPAPADAPHPQLEVFFSYQRPARWLAAARVALRVIIEDHANADPPAWLDEPGFRDGEQSFSWTVTDGGSGASRIEIGGFGPSALVAMPPLETRGTEAPTE